MIDFILEHPILVWRWGVPLLVTIIVTSAITALVSLRSAWFRRHVTVRRVTQAMCVVIALAATGGLLLRLGPLRPFVETVGRFAAMRGAPMMPLRLTRVSDGASINLQDYRGHVLVVNLWGTWCPPCRAEMPDLVRLARDYPKDVVVVTVSDEDRAIQQRFAAVVGLPPEAAVGSFPWETATFRPFTIIADRDGIVREFHFSSRDYAFFAARVRKYL